MSLGILPKEQKNIAENAASAVSAIRYMTWHMHECRKYLTLLRALAVTTRHHNHAVIPHYLSFRKPNIHISSRKRHAKGEGLAQFPEKQNMQRKCILMYIRLPQDIVYPEAVIIFQAKWAHIARQRAQRDPEN